MRPEDALNTLDPPPGLNATDRWAICVRRACGMWQEVDQSASMCTPAICVPAQNTAVALYLSQAWQMLLAVPVVS